MFNLRRHKSLWIVILWFFFLAPVIYADGNLAGLGEPAQAYAHVLVKEVREADTFVLESGETVRLIGIRAFEGHVKQRKKISRDEFGFVVKEKIDLEIPREEQAFEFTRELLEGKDVRLEFDVQQKDDDYRTLAYVFLTEDNAFVNARILEEGFADLQLQAPNLKYAAQLRKAYRQGRAYSRGMDE